MKTIRLSPGADASAVQRQLQARGQWTRRLNSAAHGGAAFLVEPLSAPLPASVLLAIAGVEAVYEPPSPHPLVDGLTPEVRVGSVVVGGPQPVLIAGPCSVESEDQIARAAAMAARAGARILRGGCFKPRSSPHSFQGIGAQGLLWMRQAATAHDMAMVTEVMSAEHAELVAEHSELIQIGARNMQNFDLLHVVGRQGRPVLLKRGLSATIEEWLLAAEHLMVSGALAVVFCERGIRSFDPQTRFLLDLGAVAHLRQVHGVAVIADPSHATGRKDLIAPLGLAALAAGASGLMVEAHPEPGLACSDGPQQLDEPELMAAARHWQFVRGQDGPHPPLAGPRAKEYAP